MGYQARAPTYQSAPPFRAAPDAFGQRVMSRSEHDGVMERSSTRVHAAPGGHSSLSLADGSGTAQFGGRANAPSAHSRYPPSSNQPPAHYVAQRPFEGSHCSTTQDPYSQLSYAPYQQQHHGQQPPQYRQQATQHVQQAGYGRQPHYGQQQPYGSGQPQQGYYPSAAPVPHLAPQAAPIAPLYCNEGGVHQGRSSTRVAAPPGGHSSFSFAHHSEPRGPPPKQAYAPSGPLQPYGYEGDSLSQHVAEVRSRNNSQGSSQLPSPPNSSGTSQAPMPASEMLYCGEGGVMRGRASTRVAAPPGGHSSLSLGWGSSDRVLTANHGRGHVHRPGETPYLIG